MTNQLVWFQINGNLCGILLLPAVDVDVDVDINININVDIDSDSDMMMVMPMIISIIVPTIILIPIWSRWWCQWSDGHSIQLIWYR